jgi:CNT family concentrative nucleoside transporter
MERLISLLGLVAFLALAWALSENRRRMNFRLIASGVALQFGLAAFLLRTSPGRQLYGMASDLITVLVVCSDEGSAFLFGETLVKECPGFTFLPAIIFVSALTAVFFHLGVLQWVVKLMAWVMVWVMDVSGAESLCV